MDSNKGKKSANCLDCDFFFPIWNKLDKPLDRNFDMELYQKLRDQLKHYNEHEAFNSGSYVIGSKIRRLTEIEEYLESESGQVLDRMRKERLRKAIKLVRRNQLVHGQRSLPETENKQHPAGPPRAAEYLLHVLLPRSMRDHVLGDLEEDYYTLFLPKFGRWAADSWYWSQVVVSACHVLLTIGERLTAALKRSGGK